MINVKRVSGVSLRCRDAFAPKPAAQVPTCPTYPGVVCRTGFGTITLKYRPVVSYRKHRHVHPNGPATLAGMVC